MAVYELIDTPDGLKLHLARVIERDRYVVAEQPVDSVEEGWAWLKAAKQVFGDSAGSS